MSGQSTTSPFIDRFEARTFSRATEVPERVKEALFNLFPEESLEHVIYSEDVTEGHHKNPISIMHAEIGEPHAEQVVRYLFSRLSKDDIKTLMDSLERRLDEDCTFFMRIDKQAAYLGYIELPLLPDVISCQIHIMKYPKCKPEDARNLLERYASQGDLEE